MKTDGSEMRPDLMLSLPPQMRHLPVHRGYPVPWFVHVNPATEMPDFRVTDADKIRLAVAHKLCWVCGKDLVIFKSFPAIAGFCFIGGPIMALNHVSAEPPSHLACAQFSVKACPFMSRSNMERRINDLPDKAEPMPGHMIDCNPGMAVIVQTMSYKVAHTGRGLLFMATDLKGMLWYKEGAPASRSEVIRAIEEAIEVIKNHPASEGIDEAKTWREVDPYIPKWHKPDEVLNDPV